MASIGPLAFAQMLGMTARYATLKPSTCSCLLQFRPSIRGCSTTMSQAVSSMDTDGEKRRYLAVPYKEKDQAKALGAKWDSTAKLWYDPGPDHNAQLDRWNLAPGDNIAATIPSKPAIPSNPAVNDRKYLDVPYNQKDEAKALGAKWDKFAKRWYDPSGSNPELSKWEAPN
jgi:putative DNA primase/helicase